MSHSRGALLALTLVLASCEAGPSAFDREGGEAASDTAAASASVAQDSVTPVTIDSPDEVAIDPAAGPMDSSGQAIATVSSASTGTGASASSDVIPTDDMSRGNTRFPRPAAVRGLYLNAWASGSRSRMTQLLEVARRTEVNSFVIDIKDASGFISHPTEIPLAVEVGATEEVRIRNLPALLDTLEANSIYPIARIVIVKDPVLSAGRPDLAIQDTASGVWVDSKGIVWLNPHQREVWDYHMAIAREVAQMGFPEIQWDYVRFPDAPESDLARAVYPGQGDTSREEALRAFFELSRQELRPLGVEVTVDVFGVTTSFSSDVGIGQVWESFIDVVDVALPMVYPSHYWQGSFGVDTPNAYPYEVVRRALEDANRRSARVPGAGLTRPWLQDFSLGQPIYDAPEVRAQIQGTYDVGIEEWILWNPGSKYTEGALEPTGGFEQEPLIRVGGTIVPVSRRWEYVDRPRAPEPPTVDSSAVETVAAPDSGAVSDTSGVLDTSGVSDTLGVLDTLGVIDSVGAASDPPPDTIGARD